MKHTPERLNTSTNDQNKLLFEIKMARQWLKRKTFKVEECGKKIKDFKKYEFDQNA